MFSLIQFWNGSAWEVDPVPGLAGTGLWGITRIGSSLWTVGSSVLLRHG